MDNTITYTGRSGEQKGLVTVDSADSLRIIASMEFNAIQELFTSNRPVFNFEQITVLNQYKVPEHSIFDKEIRKDKTVTKDTGELKADGSVSTINVVVPVARIGMNFQKLIVERRVGFMLGTPVKIEAINQDKENEQEKALLKLIEQIQNDNKTDYKNKEIARRMMSEMECAELWYVTESKVVKPKFTLRLKVLSSELGDVLYPLFDSVGDMIAFARGYKQKEKGVDIEHLDVYTSDYEYRYVSRNGMWTLDDNVVTMTLQGEVKSNPIPNVMGKIMVIYHSQPQPEWADQQSMIDREEELISNHADMNDYFGSPILAVSGQVMGWAQKGEQGKILELSEQAKANYLALAAPPESIKMEIENLEKYIYTMSQTPNISFEQMMKVGGQISGIALKLMFLDAHLAVKSKEETFGIGLQRRINLIKACIGKVIDTSLSTVAEATQVKPVITPYLPENVTELIENLNISLTDGMMSVETAIDQNPLISDSEKELSRIADDAKKSADAQNLQNGVPADQFLIPKKITKPNDLNKLT